MISTNRFTGIAICLCLTTLGATAADVPATLQHLQDNNLWGEITLVSGGIRQIQVESLQGDAVDVRQVIGALHVRQAQYALSDIRSAREIGVHRIPQRMAPYRRPRSTSVALGMELIIPGAGFFYAGDTRGGYTILGFAAIVAATAATTGSDGAAGWLPFAAWVKVASLMQLRDQVGADNAAWRERADGLAQTSGVRFPLLGLRF